MERAETRGLAALREIVESGRTLSYIRSVEERRVERLLHDAAARLLPGQASVWTWTLTEGLRDPEGAPAAVEGSAPRAVLDFIAAHRGPAVFHLRDFHEPMRDPEVCRRLRDLYASCFDSGKFVVISSPLRYLPDELAREVFYLELGLPELPEVIDCLREEAKAIAAAGGSVDASEETLGQMARSLQGLTLDDVRHAVRRALAGEKQLGLGSLPWLLEEKRQIVNRTGLIEFVASGEDIDSVGGHGALKRWLLERRKLFEMREDVSAEIVPKGLLVMGVSGCGKSLAVKAVASCFGLPLYRIDMTAVFSGRYGRAETAFVDACRTLEQVSPAVVWFDEIETGMTTHTNDPTGELGRIFAFFLTWMQEKPRGLFIAATANRIDLLPAEMIRKGRFDEVFFVDLPVADERKEIFAIHLDRRGADSSRFNLDGLMKYTESWTGAEIEQCVVSAITAARLDDREVADQDLMNAALRVVPLATTMKEQIDHIRAWAFDRAVRARPDEFQDGSLDL